jgi:hypothetical protein
MQIIQKSRLALHKESLNGHWTGQRKRCISHEYSLNFILRSAQ